MEIYTKAIREAKTKWTTTKRIIRTKEANRGEKLMSQGKMNNYWGKGLEVKPSLKKCTGLSPAGRGVAENSMQRT